MLHQVLIGLGVLYSRITGSRRQVWSSKVLWGWVLVGWGLFNVVEGIVDHHILGIHHVRTGEFQTAWDIAFLVFGALLAVGGYLLQRRGGKVVRAAAPEPSRR
jgi:uncharacterized membrane protein